MYTLSRVNRSTWLVDFPNVRDGAPFMQDGSLGFVTKGLRHFYLAGP